MYRIILICNAEYSGKVSELLDEKHQHITGGSTTYRGQFPLMVCLRIDIIFGVLFLSSIHNGLLLLHNACEWKRLYTLIVGTEQTVKQKSECQMKTKKVILATDNDRPFNSVSFLTHFTFGMSIYQHPVV